MLGWEFPPFNVGGLGVVCYYLTKYLTKYGNKIILILPRGIGSKKNIKNPNISNLEIKYVTSFLLPYETKKDEDTEVNLYKRNIFEEVKKYKEEVKKILETEKINFDLIHAHDWMTFEAGIEAKKISGKPLIVHVHSTEFDRTGGNYINQKIYEIEKKGMEEADLIITVSNFTKNKIIEKYGINEKKIRVLHNAIDLEDYEKKIKIRKRDNVVLFLGRMVLQKGPDYFLYAIKKALEHKPDIIPVMAGTGDMLPSMIEKAAELGIADKIIFTGFLSEEDVHKLYQVADLYVMPSVSEPFGITTLEALANGTPVLISKQSGVSELLNHCLKVDFWDVNEMANKILAVLHYNALKESLRENGVKEIRKFSWEKQTERCLNIYNEVLRGRKW